MAWPPASSGRLFSPPSPLLIPISHHRPVGGRVAKWVITPLFVIKTKNFLNDPPFP